MRKQIKDLTEAEKRCFCKAQPSCDSCPCISSAFGCKLYQEAIYGKMLVTLKKEK